MRLVWLKLQHFRRFENARVNLDAPVIALVGPNEAGKSTLLDALVALGTEGEFSPRDFTRDLAPTERVLEAMFLLDEDDREALREAVPEASDVRWYCIWRDESGFLDHETIPPVPWTGAAAGQVRQSLIKLRGLQWDGSVETELLERLDTAISWLPEPGNPRQYETDELDELENLSIELAGTTAQTNPAMLRKVTEHIAQMIADEKQPRPESVALELLDSRQQQILEFSESDRTIHTSYDLQDPNSWTNGVRNVARLGQFQLETLAEAVAEDRPELREDILNNANNRLRDIFADRWSQSKLTVHLGVQHQTLEIFVASDDGGLHRLADRSDGLRAYLALITFLDNKNLSTPPILVLDEAENHLHWDAQADLVKIFYDQHMASQVVYSTHSPGCLPHDLGHGVRAVLPTASDRSEVINWIWAENAGYRPLLANMGASSAALTPHRYAVATEGVADFILLPSLLREATGEEALPYQVVPGLAQLSHSGIRTIDSESDTMLYLTDGDDGGRKIQDSLHRSGIPKSRLFSLPERVVLEDLVSSETLATAVREELRRSGHEPSAPLVFPATGRAAYLDQWYQETEVDPPKKRAVACRVLELTARRPQDSHRSPLLEENHRATLKELHNLFLSVFSASE